MLSQAGRDKEIKVIEFPKQDQGDRRLGPGLWSNSESDDPQDLSLVPVKKRGVPGVRGGNCQGGFAPADDRLTGLETNDKQSLMQEAAQGKLATQ